MSLLMKTGADEATGNTVQKRSRKMTDKQKEDIIQIMMAPIECTGYRNDNPGIKIENGVIKTTQSYWPVYENRDTKQPFRYPFKPDCDMSDFAVGFYEIIYKNILKTTILDINGNMSNNEFAGDTMTSVSILTGLRDKYHCLANFWLLPMHIGRTSPSTCKDLKKWSKTSNVYPIRDYMDRFLILLKQNYKLYKDIYEKYFNEITCFENFVEIHMLKGSYVDENYEINQFSIWDEDKDKIEKRAFEMIKNRANAIADSNCAEELFSYFEQNSLLSR